MARRMLFVLAACALPVPTVWNILRGERDAVFTRGLGVVDVGREGFNLIGRATEFK